MLAALTDFRRSAHGRRGHWAPLLNIRPNKMSSVAFAKAKLRKNATVAAGSGVAIRSCVSIATRTSGHETSATMATRIILANACCGKRREQFLSDNGSLRLVRSHGERRTPDGTPEQQRISEPRTRRCPALGAMAMQVDARPSSARSCPAMQDPYSKHL
jgi:hypothetical protein